MRRYADVPPLIGAFSPGDKVDLTVVRGGDEKEFRVVIGSLSNAQLAQNEQGAPAEKTSDNPLNILVTNVPGVKGVQVEDVQPGPAQRAGMRKGDVITMMRNEFVESKEDFDRIVENLPKNGAVAVRILRGNNIVYLAIPTH